MLQHKKAESNRGTLKTGEEEAVIYTKPEDEIFHELSSWSFSFPLHSQWLKNYRPMGLVMAVEAGNASSEFRDRLKSSM
ncbi:hypothetical protein M569_06959 [Genlisea aurea]|uniref:Uncharacterized protein n=1 Tax=Genlisea aurea TaxID=192259 RepID=S8E604_9LAMI|nr:hypothetical protein M569_06959 [Genlisea aurea]